MYRLYIKKAESFYGVTRTREIHEQAIKVLADKDAQKVSLDYAHLEKRLGEVDRARAIFAHGAQFENPKRVPDYWKAWHEFEIALGNEDTFRDMLRVKRSVTTAFASETFYDMGADVAAEQSSIKSDAEVTGGAMDPMASAEAAAAGGGSGGLKRKANEGGSMETEMEALERQAARIASAKAEHVAATAATATAATAVPAATENPEEIDLDDEEEDEDEDEDEEDEAVVTMESDNGMRIAQQAVPAAVFGGLADHVGKAVSEGGQGALERFKNRG